MDIDGTDAIRLPTGDISERPISPVDGLLRYNNEFGIEGFEGFSQGGWFPLGGGSVIGLTSDITFLEGIDRIISIDDATGGPGNSLQISAGNGDGGNDGGNLFLDAGEGFDNGGNTIISAGNATNLSGRGGNIELIPGDASNRASSGVVSIISQTALALPAGADINRPIIATPGMIRYSTQSGTEGFEGFDGADWVHLGGGGFSIDGSDNHIGGSGGINLSGGFDNILIGRDAGSTIDTGNNNIVIGANAGVQSGTNDGNIAIGTSATVGGLFSIAIGDQAQVNASNSVAIGAGTVADVDNTIVLGDVNDNYNVGIGLDNPAGKLGIGQASAADAINILHTATSGDGIFIDMTGSGQGIRVQGGSGPSITTSGNVGIGIINPATELVVVGTTTLDGNLISKPAAATNGTITVTSRIMLIDGNVTNIQIGTEGQEVILVATGASILVDSTTNVRLAASADFLMSINSTLHLIFINGAWLEVSRSEN